MPRPPVQTRLTSVISWRGYARNKIQAARLVDTKNKVMANDDKTQTGADALRRAELYAKDPEGMMDEVTDHREKQQQAAKDKADAAKKKPAQTTATGTPA
jgi:hypothetical protein